ncbi:head decoration protein [Sphingobium sp. HT1-2]|uniref:head decoration protein n=1 Tax=Sphingobium sp. HT1-2 TaxID=3111640 RepID=UPI003C116C35
MAPVTFNNKRSFCYLGESNPPNQINEEIIIASGAGVLDAGTVIAKITVGGKYVVHDTALSNGAELPANAAILGHPVDATSADVKTTATVRGPATINGNMLTYKAGMTNAAKIAVRNALRAKGMAVLPQHAGE